VTTEQAKVANPSPFVGRKINDRFEVLELIHTGGISQLYKGRDLTNGEAVVVSILQNFRKQDKQSLKRFEQAIAVGKTLHHENIVPIIDSGVLDDLPFSVRPFVEGVSLKDVLSREGRIAAPRAVAIFSQLANVLQYAHEKGFVHRNLKPASVRLSGDNEKVLVTDLGIAKAVPGTAEQKSQLKLTQTKKVVGSPLYMSPEQFAARPVDARSDIYALGCILYESLTGTPPLIGKTLVETMMKHLKSYPEKLSMRCPEAQIPDYLEGIVARTLRKDPDERYQSMADLAKELASGSTTSEFRFPDSPEKPASLSIAKSAGRPKGETIVLGAICVACLLGLGWWLTMTLIVPPHTVRGSGAGIGSERSERAESDFVSHLSPSPVDRSLPHSAQAPSVWVEGSPGRSASVDGAVYLNGTKSNRMQLKRWAKSYLQTKYEKEADKLHKQVRLSLATGKFEDADKLERPNLSGMINNDVFDLDEILRYAQIQLFKGDYQKAEMFLKYLVEQPGGFADPIYKEEVAELALASAANHDYPVALNSLHHFAEICLYEEGHREHAHRSAKVATIAAYWSENPMTIAAAHLLLAARRSPEERDRLPESDEWIWEPLAHTTPTSDWSADVRKHLLGHLVN
jgi:serine/threonine protein kinase